MKWLIVNTATEIPELIMSGYISQYEKVNYGDFKAAIDQLKSQGVTRAKLIVNSGGGDMVEGLAIYDSARESGIAFDVQVVGMAASMASILIYLGNEKPTISKHARLMFHKPQSWAGGEAGTLRDRAEQMDKLEQTIKSILKAQTGQSDEVINSWFETGKETWFDATEALKYGLVREIVSSGEATQATPLPQESTSEESVWNKVYNKFLITNTKTMKFTKEFKAQFGIDENATDEQVEAKLVEINNKAKTADTLVADSQKQAKERAKTLVSNAITAGKLTEGDREEYTRKAETDYAFVESVIAKIQVPNLPLGGIQNTGAAGAGSGAGEQNVDRTKWTITDWAKNDYAGLEKLKIDNKAEYTVICRRSGVEPTFE